MAIQWSAHADTVISERGLDRRWVERTVRKPDRVLDGDDGTRHCLARIPEQEDRVLHVVLNPDTSPPTVITAFLDRRMRGRLP